MPLMEFSLSQLELCLLAIMPYCIQYFGLSLVLGLSEVEDILVDALQYVSKYCLQLKFI